jgi:hypothetical protein
MKININNYEAYFIDYMEGNLDASLVNDFIEFLQNNPDLKEELSLLEPVKLEPENILFNKKDKLYKEKLDSEKEFDKAAIANLEGDFNEEEKSEFEEYLASHPEKKKEVALFKSTKLRADESIVFSKKKKLYRHSFQKSILIWSGRVAAILIVAFAFFTLVNKPAENMISDDQVAVLEDKVKKSIDPEEKVIPVEEKKKEPEKNKKLTPKPIIKEVKPQAKPSKSLRESTKGRLSHEDLSLQRTPLTIPDEMQGITASLEIQPIKANFATIYISAPESVSAYPEERLLADVVKEKTGLNKFRFNTITKAGLKLVSNISNEKFQFETNEKGKVIEYNYDSRLLAFSIPSKNADSE